MRLGKKILIVEGPAGSGKSFIAAKLAEKIGAAHISNSLGKRGFETPEEPAIASAINDYSKMIKAIAAPEYLVIIERLILSQQVYGSIRDPDLTHNQSLYFGEDLIAQRIQHLTSMAISELSWRLTPALPSIATTTMSFLIVIPDVSQIAEQRSKTNKAYPNSAGLEYALYRSIGENLISNGVDVVLFQNKTEAQLNRLLSVVSYWSSVHGSSLSEAWRPN